MEEATSRAKLCALRVLAQIESAVGLDNVEEVAQLIGFVLSTDDFGDQPKVLNGASRPAGRCVGPCRQAHARGTRHQRAPFRSRSRSRRSLLSALADLAAAPMRRPGPLL